MNDDEYIYRCNTQVDDTVDSSTFTTECPYCGGSSWYCGCKDEADADTENTSLPASSDLGRLTHGTTQDDQEQAHQDTPLDPDLLGSKFIFESFGLAGHLSGEIEVTHARPCPHRECLSSHQTYRTKREFNLHYRWQHKKERKCRLCSYECVKKTDFDRHYFQHLPPEEQEKKRIKCKECKQKFTLAYNLERHLRKIHEMSKEEAKKAVNEL